MILPFSFTYTIINNILTIVFDFSKLDEHQFNSLGFDYFSQGVVINETGFDFYTGWGHRTVTYTIPTKDFDWDGESPINLRLFGRKVRENNQKAIIPSNSNEYAVKIHTVADYQEIIDDCEALLQKAKDKLDDLNAMAGKWVGNSAAKGMSKREAKYKSDIHSNTVALRYLRKLQARITTPQS